MSKTALSWPALSPVIWEEIARDGAQAKTLLNAEQRIEIARTMIAIFGGQANALIFAVGFPSISYHEFEIIRQVVSEVEGCFFATHGRAMPEDIQAGVAALKGCRNGRVSFYIPVSDLFCEPMGYHSPTQALRHGLEILSYALDKVQDDGFSVDVALADVGRADALFVAEAAQALGEGGAKIVKLCDSIGCLLPHQVEALVKQTYAYLPQATTLGVHLHNDLGLGLAGTLAAYQAGAQVLASSWLGLAERSGLPATEQLLAILDLYASDYQDAAQAGFQKWPRLNLKLLPLIAQQISRYTNIPLRCTDPWVGSGINSISTGTPFGNPKRFHPFDPETVLGISQQIHATQLSGQKVIAALAKQMGFELSDSELNQATAWVKNEAYSTGQAIVPPERLRDYFTHLVTV